MENEFDSGVGEFLVLVNDEEQYSLWPASLQAPGGWRAVRAGGPRAECLAWIESQWTDLRPLSLRRTLASGSAPGVPDK